MKLLTNSSMNPAIEANGAFPFQMSPRSSAYRQAAQFDRILAGGGNAAMPNSGDTNERPKSRNDGVRLGVAVLAVIGAATLWGWAIMQLCGLFLHAESLLLRNTLPL